MEAYAIHGELEGVLLDQRILRNGQNIYQTLLIETPCRNNDRKSTDVLWDHTIMDKIFGYGTIKVFPLYFEIVNILLHFRPKADGGGVHAFVDYLLKTGECTTTNEEDVCCINLDEIAPWILPTGFLRKMNLSQKYTVKE